MVVSSLLTGCASIVNGTSQVVSVEARNQGEPVTGAVCKLENSKGVFYVTTPGTVTVHRAYNDLAVKCEKDNLSPGLATVKSNTKGMAFGNILFGGAIGVAIDTGSGAAFDYPSLIRVVMGENSQIPGNAKPLQSAPAVATNQAPPAAAASIPVSAQQTERQLTSAELSDHFRTAVNSATASTDVYSSIGFETTPDGTFKVSLNSEFGNGGYGYDHGSFRIHTDDNEVCLNTSSGKLKAVWGCYHLFQLAQGEYILRSVQDKSFIKYKI